MKERYWFLGIIIFQLLLIIQLSMLCIRSMQKAEFNEKMMKLWEKETKICQKRYDTHLDEETHAIDSLKLKVYDIPNSR
jgi:hypothetical protein